MKTQFRSRQGLCQSASKLLTGRGMASALLAVTLFIGGCQNVGPATVTTAEKEDLVVTLEQNLSTETAAEGNEFQARTTEAITVNDTVAIPRDASVTGSVSHVSKPGKVEGVAELTLQFTRVQDVAGEWHDITTDPIAMKAPAETESDIEKIVAGGVAGAIIGGVAKGKEGAAAGGAIGAAAGGAYVLATEGDHLELPKGQRFAVTIENPLTVVVSDIDQQGEAY